MVVALALCWVHGQILLFDRAEGPVNEPRSEGECFLWMIARRVDAFMLGAWFDDGFTVLSWTGWTVCDVVSQVSKFGV